MSAIRFLGTARFIRKVTVTAVAAILAGLAQSSPGSASVAVQPGTAQPAAGTASLHGSNPLRGVRAYLSTRKGVVQVAVFDKRTGRTPFLVLR